MIKIEPYNIFVSYDMRDVIEAEKSINGGGLLKSLVDIYQDNYMMWLSIERHILTKENSNRLTFDSNIIRLWTSSVKSTTKLNKLFDSYVIPEKNKNIIFVIYLVLRNYLNQIMYKEDNNFI